MICTIDQWIRGIWNIRMLIAWVWIFWPWKIWLRVPRRVQFWMLDHHTYAAMALTQWKDHHGVTTLSEASANWAHSFSTQDSTCSRMCPGCASSCLCWTSRVSILLISTTTAWPLIAASLAIGKSDLRVDSRYVPPVSSRTGASSAHNSASRTQTMACASGKY